MRSIFFSFCFLFISGIAVSQETLYGCISIDFETIPGGVAPYEGMPIGDQYFDLFGLSFSLEGGGIPVLAEVGSPTTAFGGAFGNDTPAPFPDQGFGQFFITDDGQLSGLTSPPLILHFDTPIDSFAGCVMDMDYDEQFIIQAFDENAGLILSDTIKADPLDPTSGDGIATCWGFNLDGCNGIVSTIRFEGTRETSGAFGLGLDRFSFCYSGLNLGSTAIQPTCLALNGSLQVFSTSSDVYEFSLDGINYLSSGSFDNLGPAVYEIFVRDEFGCETSVFIEIKAAEDPLFVEVDVQNTTCKLDNGSVSFDVTPDIGATFSIDGGTTYLDVNSFSDLAPRDYVIQAIDENFCTGDLSFTIEPSTLPEIKELTGLRESCQEDDGAIVVIDVDNGTAPYQYSVNGINYQDDSTLSDLSDGDYMVVVKDAIGCLDSAKINVPAYPSILVSDVTSVDPSCVTLDGEIQITATGGIGELDFAINNGSGQADGTFVGLDHGMHHYTIIDEEGCALEDSLYLAIPLCPVFVPNIISANNDGVNDQFIISVHPDYPAEVLCYWIFDRWGELVYQSKNYSIHYRENAFQNYGVNWWNGYFLGQPAEQGVYAYLIEIRHENGTKETLVGDVTLIR